MKTKLLLSLILLALVFFTGKAQVQKGFNYQAIARDASGITLVNKSMPVRITIQSDSTGGDIFWQEVHSYVTTNSFGMINIVIGKGAKVTGTAPAFSAIDWSAGPKFIRTEINYGGWIDMGSSRLWSVPYALYADQANGVSPGSKLSVTSSNDLGTDALFEVRRKDGQTVFAVYPDAVNIYVPRSSKGAKGGFAVGGFDQTKLGPQDYFRVTPDSVRIYIDPNPTTKGTKGGFAVGGYDQSKGISNMYFNLSGASTVNTVNASPQVLWYPNKNAFLAGNVHIGHVDSVGNYSTALGYQSRAIGNYSQAFGYKATAFGDYSTSIGKRSVAGVYKSKHNSFALGNSTQALGEDSYAFGSGAKATGPKSFAFGSVSIDSTGNVLTTPTTASGNYSTAIGMGAQATNTGSLAFGNSSLSGGYASLAMGFYSSVTSSASYGVAIGYYASSSGYYGHAFGLKAQAAGTGSLALGMYAYALGSYSAAVGYSANSTNQYSLAMGYYARSMGDYSAALGRSALASGPSSVAIGPSATTGASANNAGSFGYGATANGANSVAVGYGAITGATDASAFGKSASASGATSMALGTSAVASGSNSVSIGYSSDATNTYSVAMGYNAQSTGQYAMALGYNPTASNSYSTAIGYQSEASGLYSTALGYSSKAYGTKSLALGSFYSYTYFIRKFSKLGGIILVPITVNIPNTATRDFSVAVGNGNTAQDGGIALGSNNQALSNGAVALGHTNIADTSFAFAAGYNNASHGYNAFAMGENVTAESSNSFVIGAYNATNAGYNKYEWVDTDPLFVIGNGDATTAHDALVTYKNGYTRINAEDASYAMYAYNSSPNRVGSVYGVYANATSTNASNTSSVIGNYAYAYNAGSGTTYGVYSGSYNYGTGSLYGVRSYVYNGNSGNVNNIYSGYFYGSTTGAAGYYQGLYADKRSGSAIDLAEYIYDSQGNTQPADVVVADPDKKESVVKSTKPYQASVVGVISTKPHLTMGMELVTDEKTGEPLPGVSATRLALSGRVPVNVCGENGPIAPGDYITTSSTPGTAMKWSLLDINAAKDFDDLKKILSENERRRNAIIGKAVDSFTDSGTGKIIVLISLQ